MGDRKGDASKQPPECAPRFTPFGPDYPKPAGAPGSGTWSRCPNIRESHSDMQGETYDCAVCGEHYRLYYEDMA